MELRAPTENERRELRALLSANGLPVSDLETAAIDFTVAADADRIVGVIGLEAFDGAGLLRSLAVAPTSRNGGTGARLVEAVEAHARSRGLQSLVLLTQTAEPFFARRGYRTVARSEVPASVQGSGEFRSICPASATCMIKQLD